MKHREKNSILFLYLMPFVLIVGIALCSFVSYFYTTTTVDKNGKVKSTVWIKEFAHDFTKYIERNSDGGMVTEDGCQLLRDNQLWIQILDPKGRQIWQYHKPDSVPTEYEPFELLTLYQHGAGDYSTCVGQMEESGDTYIIGYPLKISKVVTYVDTDRYDSGKSMILLTMGMTVITILVLGIIYTTVISDNFKKIQVALNQIATRSFTPIPKKWFLHEIYDEINHLYEELHKADAIREKDEIARIEWLTNITHDLKTPLAPIKGYGELLADSDASVSCEKATEYGNIISKNINYAEQLINDLKLTYQMQSGMMPMEKKRENLTRFLKERIIDLLNHPEYETRDLNYTAPEDTVWLEFDLHLMKRAIDNLIINSIIHTESNTWTDIVLISDHGIRIQIIDNGGGMTEEALQNLFVRYYRGTNTSVKPEGTGLGMAIAKQIIELHGGTITAESQLDQGTSITICFPEELRLN